MYRLRYTTSWGQRVTVAHSRKPALLAAFAYTFLTGKQWEVCDVNDKGVS